MLNVGNKVKLKISTYPYERTGHIISIKGGKKNKIYTIRVEYNKVVKFFYKKEKEIEVVK